MYWDEYEAFLKHKWQHWHRTSSLKLAQRRNLVIPFTYRRVDLNVLPALNAGGAKASFSGGYSDPVHKFEAPANLYDVLFADPRKLRSGPGKGGSSG